MVLVAYSDSEGSDTEIAAPTKPLPRHVPASAAKSNFQKVVDRSDPHKIRVNLPDSSTAGERIVDRVDDIGGDRPAKRAKSSSALNGFNALLPAPKNAAKPVNSSVVNAGLGRSPGTGLGHGINLKTGSAPAFSREALPATEARSAEEEYPQSENWPEAELDVPSHQEEVELVGKPMMFKPLSVARKPTKKKGLPLGAAGTTSAMRPIEQDRFVEVPKTSDVSVPKPKQSLFSTFSDAEITIPSQDAAEYEPELVEPDTREIKDDSGSITGGTTYETTSTTQSTSTQPNSLEALADSIGLTPAQRRQLFGRNGAAPNAQVSNFSLAAEYSHNNALRENEAAAPAQNPVRAIAPGKHSLQQLVNAVASQKEALEESFATGRRNKKEAGSKYGW